MGLDVTGVSNIRVLHIADEYSESIERFVSQEFINPDFPHAVPDNFVDHEYIQWESTPETETHGFRAGSYSGYGLFRGTLSAYSMGENSYDERDKFWTAIEDGKYKDKPFYELIDFSDCEGTFYGPVCEKIYQDFATHRESYSEWVERNNPFEAWSVQGWLNRYDDFMRAFDLARHGGLVSFH